MSNFLEQLVAEFYEERGYFVRRNVQVGKRSNGGYEGELDVVAFHPGKRHLVHIEPSMDCYKWEKREQRFARKFKTGKKYIPKLFEGFALPPDIEQIALLMYGGSKDRPRIGGGRLMMIDEFMAEIRQHLHGREVGKHAVPEQFSILRALQFATNYWDKKNTVKEKPLSKNDSGNKPKIIFDPSNENDFKALLIKHKKACFTLHKSDGTAEKRVWSTSRFKESSALRGNILSGPLRNWKEKSIVKAVFSVAQP